MMEYFNRCDFLTSMQASMARPWYLKSMDTKAQEPMPKITSCIALRSTQLQQFWMRIRMQKGDQTILSIFKGLKGIMSRGYQAHYQLKSSKAF